MSERHLTASINEVQVGTLREVAGLWSFEYATAWLKDPKRFALSPHLPLTAEVLLDGASKRPVQWYFDNLLPEEGQRLLLAGDGLLLDAAASLNLVKGTAKRLLENIRSRAVPVAEALYAEVEAENAKIVSVRPELAPVFAGEAHCLRSILHGVIKDMTRQIA